MYVSGATARPQLTPPQYVRIIASAALFRDRGVGAGGGGEREDGMGEGEEEQGGDPAGILQQPQLVPVKRLPADNSD